MDDIVSLFQGENMVECKDSGCQEPYLYVRVDLFGWYRQGRTLVPVKRAYKLLAISWLAISWRGSFPKAIE
jgi:hypothetical protein